MVLSDYDERCREIEESEAAEFELFRREMRDRGIELCWSDSCGCNMAIVSKSGAVLCCAVYVYGVVANRYYCGRIWLKGVPPWGGSLGEKINRSKILDICCNRPHNELCFFDKKDCGSGLAGKHLKDFGNGCVVRLVDKAGFGSVWYCARIWFANSKVSIDEKIRSQHLLDHKGGENL